MEEFHKIRIVASCFLPLILSLGKKKMSMLLAKILKYSSSAQAFSESWTAT